MQQLSNGRDELVQLQNSRKCAWHPTDFSIGSTVQVRLWSRENHD